MSPALVFVQEHAAWIALVEGAGGILAIGGLLYRFIECQHPECHRLGLHPHQHLRLCTLHHPDTPEDGRMTVEHIERVAGTRSVGDTPETGDSHDPAHGNRGR